MTIAAHLISLALMFLAASVVQEDLKVAPARVGLRNRLQLRPSEPRTDMHVGGNGRRQLGYRPPVTRDENGRPGMGFSDRGRDPAF
jgi:hypothetical protein